jgi:sigma-E factor negative regulatory protein RseC
MSENCHEIGVVTAHGRPGYVRVKIERAEACHSCAAQGACATLGGQKADIVLEVANTEQALPGDSVRISLAESSVVTAAAVLYLLPALGLVLGAFAGNSHSAALGMSGDPAAALGAVVGLGLGLLTARLVSGRLSKNPRFVPQMVEIVARVRRP